MASAAFQSLPLFYNDLAPISSNIHAEWRLRTMDSAAFLTTAHAVPLLAEEFPLAARHYPIVFSSGETAIPLALMGLNEGVNAIVDEQGMFPPNAYVPAYIRRYPFMLARLRQDSEDLSLCFDPTSGAVGKFEEGDPVFEGAEPSERTKGILNFCEGFETASLATASFIKELQDQKLLIDGEFKVEQPGGASHVYRGFNIISEDALKALRGDVARKWINNGILSLVYAHLFSLSLLGDLFAKQTEKGKVPPNFTMPA